jgi:predicted 3-demethylubiquinone-9 3-methyltransferase (glyoxalase superfamily)
MTTPTMTLDEAAEEALLTYLAIFDDESGYAIDCYPEELADARRDYGKHVLGEFATGEEAQAVAFAKVAAKCAALNARREQGRHGRLGRRP